jgi:hypothetical protein
MGRPAGLSDALSERVVELDGFSAHGADEAAPFQDEVKLTLIPSVPSIPRLRDALLADDTGGTTS